MNTQVSRPGLDFAFLCLETPNIPMHLMGKFALDVWSATGAYSFGRPSGPRGSN